MTPEDHLFETELEEIPVGMRERVCQVIDKRVAWKVE